MQSPCRILPVVDYRESVPKLLDAIGVRETIATLPRILIKPNLVNQSPPPITLPVAMAEVLIETLRSWTPAEIVIAEGTGEKHLETVDVFRTHGYDRLAERLGISLIDLNHAPLVRLEKCDCEVFPWFMIPRIMLDSFVVSVAVLNAHTLAGVTLSMKNMIGCAPPSYYQQGGHWKKSAFHARMHRSIFDLNTYRKPDLAIVDASVGMAKSHLGGPTCDPPVGKLIAGFDPVAVDAAGARLLGLDWREVEHICLADGRLGSAEAGLNAVRDLSAG